MKSVLVVGAGPAGLVAAKTLLRHGGGKHYKVSIFEAAERVGGMWRAIQDEDGDKCNPNMRTNLSRFTVAFSDLSWSSVNFLDTDDKENATTTQAPPPPMFPRAWQVGKYLEEYTNRFIPDGTIFCNREVTDADLVESEPRKWTVSSFDKVSQTKHKNEFDHLIIASGFFGKPYNAVGNGTNQDALACKIQHSSKFRHISSLSTTPGNIVVIGGGISGSEAAATAAFQISNTRNSPGTGYSWENGKIIHIINRPFYCLPRYLPQEPYNPAKQDFNLSPHFLPLDLVLYNLSRRGQGDIFASNGGVPPKKAKKGHDFIRSCIGGDQRDLGIPELIYKQEHTQYPSFTGISDMYSEFVRSGLIVPKQGHAKKISRQTSGENGSQCTDLLEVDVLPKAPWSTISQEGETCYKIQDVVGIIEATGFHPNLNYLSEKTKKYLQFDPDCNRLPLILGKGSVFSPENKCREIAFVGFYEGPYWSVMEAQAQLVAETWSSHTSVSISDSALFSSSEQISLREAIKNRALDIPQFWMSDYVGLVEEIFREACIKRNDTGFAGQSGPTFPSRYVGPSCDKNEAEKVLREVGDVLKDSREKGRFAATATFRGMQGIWMLERKIDSRLASMPGGTYKGTAHFHPRVPTHPTYSAEYLYMEEGMLKMDNGYSFPATRRYVYRFDETTDTITAWFTADDGVSVGNFFNKWEFQKPEDVEHGWIAKGSHWCSPDTYKNSCEFRFRGASLETFGITYEATGPKKDYTHVSWYRRPRG